MSGGFGAPDALAVKEIISNSPGFKDYKLDIKVTSYIRG